MQLKTCVAAPSVGQRSFLGIRDTSLSVAGPFCGCTAFARLPSARALRFRYKLKGFVSYCCLTSLIKHRPSAEVALPAAAQRRAVFQARISPAPSGQARCSESVLWRTLTRKKQNWTPHFTLRSNRFSLREFAAENLKCPAQPAQSLPAVTSGGRRLSEFRRDPNFFPPPQTGT